MAEKKIKLSKCKSCGCEYQKFRSTQKVCNTIECALILVKDGKEKEAKRIKRKEAAEFAVRREAVRPLKFFRVKAETAFHAFVRARDAKLKCISCRKPATWEGQFHAGHFYTRAARPDIQFNEDNCHKQCSQCNNYLSANLIPYRKALIRKIGIEKFEALSTRIDIKPTREYYKAIEKEYKQKLKDLHA